MLPLRQAGEEKEAEGGPGRGRDEGRLGRKVGRKAGRKVGEEEKKLRRGPAAVGDKD